MDISNIKMEDQAQTSVLPVASDDTEDLFAEANGQGEGESAPVPLVTDSANRPVVKLLFRPSSRQPFNPSESNRRTFQPKHSYLFVFIDFCSAFFVFGEQFYPSWVMCKQYCQCLINILLCDFICGIYLCGIFMYVYGGPSILWTCQIFNPHKVHPFCRLIQF